jgi:poly(3-hydroxybutyrate) depolymerase
MLTSGTGGTGTGGAAGAGAGFGGVSGGGAASAGTSAAGVSSGSGGGTSGAAGSTGSGGLGGNGGTGGTGNAAGTGAGGATPATPSAGCAKGNPRPPNGTVTVANDHIYTFPASYDGRTPMPLMIGFHAAGNPINQIQNFTNGSPLEMNFVRAFPKSAGSAWVYNTDISKVRTMWDDLLNNYCIDTSKVFGTGHSSGAQMIVQMLCMGETRFKAVAPVAASKYCNSFSPVAALYIQGMMDAQRGNSNGADVVQVFRTSNMCESSSTPKTDVQMCRSSLDNAQVTPGCITYDGCTVPTLWCSHNDNGYNTTDGRQHGWPCFATSTIAAFFQSFR